MDTTSLCSVCVEAESKYTCPVCTARTCSLVCSKRHKLWTSCEGQQRPGAFKSKSDLHRPSQVAADFDFLNSIQRSLDRAADSHGPSRSQPPPDHRIKDICKARGLVIFPAPLQSSRASQNHTIFNSHSNRIIWTVEWVVNGSTVATVELDESLTVNDAFENQVLPSLPTTPFPDAKTPLPLELVYHLWSIEPHSQTITLLLLAAKDTLSKALVNATVLEFPTIQVSIVS
ncbi:uncharacterized protein DFL_006212 [Arthrobotrys flagrans]|uniref:HIT-type domain-containing protein n=1 Tax=Arthrobotrys flagrans TaxID=97331 RepID=A0A437A0H8_ARTFL|nr:hypothetical protein DFL_006212 [Arthrobotrys flagrans]